MGAMNRRLWSDGCRKAFGAFVWDAGRLGPALLIGLMLPAGMALGQHDVQSGASSPSVTHGDLNSGLGPAPGVDARMQEQMVIRRNSERQKQLVADTEKLFQLAQQLRDEVARSNKDQLSIPVVKKSDEIEKLAKSVKEKMRGY